MSDLSETLSGKIGLPGGKTCEEDKIRYKRIRKLLDSYSLLKKELIKKTNIIIYSQYNISKGYMRIMNFVKLSDKVLNPFEYRNGVGQMLEAAVERKQEPEEVAALSFLLKNGFVSVKEGKLSPEFATISYADYKAVKDKLSDGINRMAELIAQHRDMAGEELRKKTPATISTANEVGSMVSMWSILEGMVAIALEDGFVTKGNGQNLAAYYFNTENK